MKIANFLDETFLFGVFKKVPEIYDKCTQKKLNTQKNA